jgi:hypothetical protein
MRVFRRLVIVAASVMAAAGIGVVGTGTASAQSFSYLCVVDPSTGNYVCAYGNGSSAIEMKAEEPSTTNWFLNSDHQLQQANTDLCMQVDHDAENAVIEATCANATYQEWGVVYTEGGYNIIESDWGSTALCLTYNKSKSILDVVGCDDAEWYEQFYALPE